MKNKTIYDFFFPKNKILPFRKTRWFLMILIQELSMCKFKSVFKFFYKKSYRNEILFLMDILSKGKLKATKGVCLLSDVVFSHEINYPEWVEHLIIELEKDPQNYKRIKVFHYDNKFYVIDGNHRLKALKSVLSQRAFVRVLFLKYESNIEESKVNASNAFR